MEIQKKVVDRIFTERAIRELESKLKELKQNVTFDKQNKIDANITQMTVLMQIERMDEEIEKLKKIYL
jgi:predicted component of type VI protein secretion system